MHRHFRRRGNVDGVEIRESFESEEIICQGQRHHHRCDLWTVAAAPSYRCREKARMKVEEENLETRVSTKKFAVLDQIDQELVRRRQLERNFCYT